MADDITQRSFRLSDRPVRPKSSNGTDPLAELARLIGQTDPFGEYRREQTHVRADSVGELRVPRAAAPAAEWSLPPGSDADRDAELAPVPGYSPRVPSVETVAAPAAFAEHGHDEPDALHADNDARGNVDEHLVDEASIAPLDGEQEDFYEPEPDRRRTAMIAIASVFALAVIGSAGALGYRALLGNTGTVPPPIIKPDSNAIKVEPPKPSTKTVQEHAPAAPERLMPPEEKPVELKSKPPGVILGDETNPSAPTAPTPGVIITEPKKIHTVAIRPDGAVVDSAPPAAPPTAAPPAAVSRVPAPPARPPVAEQQQQQRVTEVAPPSRSAPLSLNPNAAPSAPVAPPAPKAPAAAPVAPAAPNGAATGYAVQVSSQRSEAEAQAAFRGLQAKFPSQLGGHQLMVRRVELGAKGVYFRAMVGPFASAEEASKLCSSLKSAGGSCIVQKI